MGAWKDWEIGMIEGGASRRQIAQAEARIKGTTADPVVRAADPYPCGARVTVIDHDHETVLGPYLVVRSYWPSSCVELLVEEPHSHMVRQSHDRIIGKEGAG